MAGTEVTGDESRDSDYCGLHVWSCGSEACQRELGTGWVFLSPTLPDPAGRNKPRSLPGVVFHLTLPNSALIGWTLLTWPSCMGLMWPLLGWPPNSDNLVIMWINRQNKSREKNTNSDHPCPCTPRSKCPPKPKCQVFQGSAAWDSNRHKDRQSPPSLMSNIDHCSETFIQSPLEKI